MVKANVLDIWFKVSMTRPSKLFCQSLTQINHFWTAKQKRPHEAAFLKSKLQLR